MLYSSRPDFYGLGQSDKGSLTNDNATALLLLFDVCISVMTSG